MLRLLISRFPTSLLLLAALSSQASSEAASNPARAFDVAQCTVRLLIPERAENTLIPLDEATASLQGSGRLNPFIIAVDGQPATRAPVISGCFDLRLSLETLPAAQRDRVRVLIEPL